MWCVVYQCAYTRVCVCVSHVLVTCFTSHGHHPGWSSYRTGYYSQACTCVLDEPGVCPGSCRYNIRIVTPWNPVKTSLPGHILRIPRYTAANNVEMRYEGEKCRIGRHGAPDPLRGYSEPVQTRSTESQVVVSHSGHLLPRRNVLRTSDWLTGWRGLPVHQGNPTQVDGI